MRTKLRRLVELTLTEYDGEIIKPELSVQGLLIRGPENKFLFEDYLCKIFSNNELLIVRAEWTEKDPSIYDQVLFMDL